MYLWQLWYSDLCEQTIQPRPFHNIGQQCMFTSATLLENVMYNIIDNNYGDINTLPTHM